MRRIVATVAIAVTLAAGLTGCGRLGAGAGASDGPSPAVSSSTGDAAVDDVLTDLDAVDAALTQANEDALAGDDAAATDDAP